MPATVSGIAPERMDASVPIVTDQVAVVESRRGETFDDFLHRVGLVLDAHSTATCHEACGQLWVQPGAEHWGVRLTTNHAHLACRISGEPPSSDTWERMNRAIHSHAARGREFRYSSIDRQFLRGRLLYLGWQVHQGLGFSEADRKLGPGYLVQEGWLWTRDEQGHLTQARLRRPKPDPR